MNRACPVLPNMQGHILLLCALMLLLTGCAAKGPAPLQRGFPAYPVTMAAAPTQEALGAKIGKQARYVKGGWGYSKKDAFIILGGKRGQDNAIALERKLVEARNTMEFMESPAAGKRWAVLSYGTVSRTLRESGGRMFAVWRGKVGLVAEREAPEHFSPPGASRAKAVQGQARVKRAPAMLRMVERDYCFDITAVYAGKRPR